MVTMSGVGVGGSFRHSPGTQDHPKPSTHLLCQPEGLGIPSPELRRSSGKVIFGDNFHSEGQPHLSCWATVRRCLGCSARNPNWAEPRGGGVKGGASLLPQGRREGP